MKYMLMNTMMSEDTGGGGAPAVENSLDTPPAAPFVAPEWAKGLNVEEEILKAPLFSSVKSVDDIVKGYYHAQKLVGADRIAVPTAKSTPEEIRAYYQKAGLPESLEKYEIQPKEGSFFSTEEMTDIKKIAYENNVNPTQLAKLLETVEAKNAAMLDTYEKESAASVESTKSELIKEWGEDGYKKNIHRAQSVVNQFGGQEMLEYLDQSGLGNDGKLIRFLASIGGKLKSEDSFAPDITHKFGTSREEAQKEINAIFGDGKSPYFDGSHPQHKDMVAKMLTLQEIIAKK